MILYFLLTIFCEDKELLEFLNKDIKIFFSGYTSIFLGLEADKSELTAHNKYASFEKLKFNPKARIVKTGNTYELYFMGLRMCRQGNIIARCSTPGNWSIDRKYFGYSLSKDGLCITKDIDDTVKMKKCVDTDDQIFLFKFITPDCNPEANLTNEHSIHVNLMQDKVKKYTVKTLKSPSNKSYETVPPVQNSLYEEFYMEE